MQRSAAFNYDQGPPEVFLSSDRDVINEGEDFVVCVTVQDEWPLSERVDLIIETMEHDSNGNYSAQLALYHDQCQVH